jgi:hypothetical protein
VRQQIGTAITAAALFLFSGCQGAKEMIGVLGELQAAARAVAKATGHENVTANLVNDRFLTIGMVDSALGALPDDRREALDSFEFKASELAQSSAAPAVTTGG